MPFLCPTPPELLVDPQGRPYFLWDVDLTIEAFRGRLRSGAPEDRAYWFGKLMRQAKPDDVFEFVTAREIESLWPILERYLGRSREDWRWILGVWGLRVAG